MAERSSQDFKEQGEKLLKIFRDSGESNKDELINFRKDLGEYLRELKSDDKEIPKELRDLLLRISKELKINVSNKEGDINNLGRLVIDLTEHLSHVIIKCSDNLIDNLLASIQGFQKKTVKGNNNLFSNVEKGIKKIDSLEDSFFDNLRESFDDLSDVVDDFRESNKNARDSIVDLAQTWSILKDDWREWTNSVAGVSEESITSLREYANRYNESLPDLIKKQTDAYRETLKDTGLKVTMSDFNEMWLPLYRQFGDSAKEYAETAILLKKRGEDPNLFIDYMNSLRKRGGDTESAMLAVRKLSDLKTSKEASAVGLEIDEGSIVKALGSEDLMDALKTTARNEEDFKRLIDSATMGAAKAQAVGGEELANSIISTLSGNTLDGDVIKKFSFMGVDFQNAVRNRDVNAVMDGIINKLQDTTFTNVDQKRMLLESFNATEFASAFSDERIGERVSVINSNYNQGGDLKKGFEGILPRLTEVMGAAIGKTFIATFFARMQGELGVTFSEISQTLANIAMLVGTLNRLFPVFSKNIGKVIKTNITKGFSPFKSFFETIKGLLSSGFGGLKSILTKGFSGLKGIKDFPKLLKGFSGLKGLPKALSKGGLKVLKGAGKTSILAAAAGAVEAGFSIYKGIKKLRENPNMSDSERIKTKGEMVGGVGRATLSTAGAIGGAALGSFIGPVGTVIGGALGGFLGDFLGKKLMPLIQEPLAKFGERAKEVFGKMFTFWKKIYLEPVIKAVKLYIDLIKGWWGVVTDAWKQLTESIKSVLTSLWEGIKSIWEKIRPALISLWESIKDIWEKIKPALISLWEGIKGVWEKIKPVVVTIIKGIAILAAAPVVGALISVIGTITVAIGAVLGVIYALIKVIQVWVNTIKGVIYVFTHFPEVWESVKESFVSFFNNLWESVKEGFVNFFNNLWESVKSHLPSFMRGKDNKDNKDNKSFQKGVAPVNNSPSVVFSTANDRNAVSNNIRVEQVIAKDNTSDTQVASNAKGLSFVPKKLLSWLHPGEAVLDRNEADNYRKNSFLGSTLGGLIGSIGGPIGNMIGSFIGGKLGGSLRTEKGGDSSQIRLEKKQTMEALKADIRSKKDSKRDTIFQGSMSDKLNTVISLLSRGNLNGNVEVTTEGATEGGSYSGDFQFSTSDLNISNDIVSKALKNSARLRNENGGNNTNCALIANNIAATLGANYSTRVMAAKGDREQLAGITDFTKFNSLPIGTVISGTKAGQKGYGVNADGSHHTGTVMPSTNNDGSKAVWDQYSTTRNIAEWVEKYAKGGFLNILTPDKLYGSDKVITAPQLAVGLDYVPYDEFPALLHKGERVLTEEQARLMDSLYNSNTSYDKSPYQGFDNIQFPDYEFPQNDNSEELASLDNIGNILLRIAELIASQGKQKAYAVPDKAKYLNATGDPRKLYRN